ncbi:MAG: hypothetical protein AB7Q42_00625 [Acidimicrobiia bacterium]
MARAHHLRDRRNQKARKPERIDVELAVVEALLREGRGWSLPPPIGSASAPA